MTTYQKTPFIILAVVALALITGIYTYKTNPDQTTDQPATSTVATTTPIDTPVTTVTPNGTCGLLVTSHNVNAKASLIKPIIVSGIVDNTNRQTLGCSWQMFEGQLGSAQAFVFVNNAWKSISKQTPVPVANWMTDKTTFSVELRINTGTMNIAAGTPVKVVFTEENPAAINPSKTYTLPLVTATGELNTN